MQRKSRFFFISHKRVNKITFLYHIPDIRKMVSIAATYNFSCLQNQNISTRAKNVITEAP
jgi:hypothetical protein